jgi:hypothetical protein
MSVVEDGAKSDDRAGAACAVIEAIKVARAFEPGAGSDAMGSAGVGEPEPPGAEHAVSHASAQNDARARRAPGFAAKGPYESSIRAMKPSFWPDASLYPRRVEDAP